MTPARAATIAIVGLAVLVGAVSPLTVNHAEHALPLSDAGIIRQQAAEKRLDPALIAAVIYAETKFEPRPSAAGAQGLMQILPATAYYLAHLSGGTRFTASDLASPSINVAYGSYYLATCSTTTPATRCSRWRPTTAAWRTSMNGLRRRTRKAGASP